MKKRYGLSLFGGVLVLAFALSDTRSMACGLAWTTPKGHFDGVDEQGKLSYWEKIGDLDLGKDLKIPLIMGFESSHNLSSPYLGAGWTLALLDSNIVQVDDKRFTMVQPDGWTSRFWRKRATDTTLSGQKGWMAEITGNQITIWAKCGWKMVFTDGRITSMTTSQNQQLTYVYEGGIVNEIDEDGVPILKVSLDPATGAVSGLSLNGKQIGITEEQKPRVENINGQTVVGGVKQSLEKLTLADGSVETFKFAVTPKLLPTLAISGVNNRSFSWDPVSRLILQDGDWSYNVVPGQQQPSNPQINRVNKAGQSEYYYNSPTGVITEETIDGTRRITTSFISGPLRGKIRKIETKVKGITYSSYHFNYDETGKMVRILDVVRNQIIPITPEETANFNGKNL